MKLQYLRAFIVLLAGLIALIINIKMGRNVTLSLLIVLVVILIFYVIGTLCVEILQKGMEKAADKEFEEEQEIQAAEEDESESENQTTDFSFDEDEDEE